MRNSNVAWCQQAPQVSPPTTVAIIGGGLAGVACAYALVHQGVSVVLFEAQDKLAAVASGNKAGILKPQFSPREDVFDAFYSGGFALTRELVLALSQDYDLQYDECGVLQCAFNERVAKRQQGVLAKRDLSDDIVRAMTQAEASVLAGVPLEYGGVFYPGAMWVNPASFCNAMVEACGDKLEVRLNASVELLAFQYDVWDIGGEHFSQVVVASGQHSKGLLSCQDYPLTHSIGQLTEAKPQNDSLTTILNYDGYITPAIEGSHVLGATFRPAGSSDLLCEADHQQNLESLKQVSPALASQCDITGGRVAVRTVTPDHLPLVGPVHNKAEFEDTYMTLAKGNVRNMPAPLDHKGLYVCTGFGAKGLAACVQSATLIASLVCDKPLSMREALYRAVHPSRFWFRAMQRS
jgi:tRNA 5-methylaminomethyl-2-thiouridine biosynthesis bifunctional protein